MVKKDNVRVTMTLSRDLVNNIDMVAEKYGLSRASICSYWIGQGCVATMQAWEALKALPEKMLIDEKQ